MTHNRWYLFASLLVAAAVLLGACAPATSSPGGSAKSPIKIGLLQDLTGPMAVTGIGGNKGVDIYLENMKFEVAGRQIEVIKEDSKTDPKTALERAKKLVELDKVNLIAGITNSGSAIAVKGYVNEVKAPYVSMTMAGAEALTLDNPSPYVFRTTYADGQTEFSTGRYLSEKLGYKKAVTLVTDYVGGWGKGWAFKTGFEQAGGKVIQELFSPIGEMDFASYITQMNPGADVVWAFFPDEGMLRFPKQYAEMGMLKKVPMSGYFNLAADRDNLPVLKDSALGFISSTWYNPYCDTEENKLFQKLHQAKYGVMGDIFEESGWRGMAFITAALKSVNGNIEDTDKFLKALSTTKINGPCGPLSLDENRNIVQDIMLQKVEKVGDKYQNKVMDTFKQVRQPPAGTTINPNKK